MGFQISSMMHEVPLHTLENMMHVQKKPKILLTCAEMSRIEDTIASEFKSTSEWLQNAINPQKLFIPSFSRHHSNVPRPITQNGMGTRILNPRRSCSIGSIYFYVKSTNYRPFPPSATSPPLCLFFNITINREGVKFLVHSADQAFLLVVAQIRISTTIFQNGCKYFSVNQC